MPTSPFKKKAFDLACLYLGLSAAFGTVVGVGAYSNSSILDTDSVAEKIKPALTLPPLAAGECYYLDTTHRNKLTFERYPKIGVIPATIIYTGSFLKYHWSEDGRVVFPDAEKDVFGELPVFKSANCSVLTDESKLTVEQAHKTLNESAAAILQSIKSNEVFQKLQGRRGGLNLEKVPNPS